jgi:competence protein ComEC
MASRGVYSQVWISEPATLRVERDGPTPSKLWMRAVGATQNFIRGWTERLIPEPHSGLLLSMMLGERRQLPESADRALRRSGLYHLTAVSGLHLSALTVGLALILKCFGVPRRLCGILVLPTVALLVAATGFRLPTIRAALMGAVVTGAVVFQRRDHVVNNLGFAALAILMASPLNLFQAGFQLSFLAVLGILLVCNHLSTYSKGWTGWSHRLATALGASVGAFAFTAPLIAYHHGLISPVAILANLLAVPLAAFCLWTGTTMVLLAPLARPVASVLALANLGALDFILRLAEAASDFPLACFEHLYPSIFTVSGIYLGMLVMMTPREAFRGWCRVRRHQAILLLACFVVWAEVLTGWGPLQVHFLSTGQGDSTLIQFPRGGCLLVDGGGRRPEGAVQTYLKRRRIGRLDLVMVTHPEADHIGEIPELVREVPVGLFIDAGVSGDTKAFRELQKALFESGCPHVSVTRGQQIEGIPGVRLSILHPGTPSDRDSGGTNDQSIVLEIGYGKIVLLLTGDIGREVEEEITRLYPDSECTVLKVPHHGSNTSTSDLLLHEWQPEIAVIEVGKENAYGHPHPQVLARLARHGVPVFRTDRDGSIQFITNGRSYRLHTGRRSEPYLRAD